MTISEHNTNANNDVNNNSNNGMMMMINDYHSIQNEEPQEQEQEQEQTLEDYYLDIEETLESYRHGPFEYMAEYPPLWLHQQLSEQQQTYTRHKELQIQLEFILNDIFCAQAIRIHRKESLYDMPSLVHLLVTNCPVSIHESTHKDMIGYAKG